MRRRKGRMGTSGLGDDGSADGARGRREGRGLGPFSGGQITLMVVTLTALLVFPVGAWAVVNSNVAITDPGGVNRAKVDIKGNVNAALHDSASGTAAKVDTKNNLNVALHDATTGVAAKVNGLGQQLVSTTGPASLPYGQINPSSTSWTLYFTGGPVYVTSITVDVWSVTPGASDAIQIGLSSDSCATAFTVEAVNPAGPGATQFTYGNGFSVPNGESVCVKNLDPANLGAAVFAWVHV